VCNLRLIHQNPSDSETQEQGALRPPWIIDHGDMACGEHELEGAVTDTLITVRVPYTVNRFPIWNLWMSKKYDTTTTALVGQAVSRLEGHQPPQPNSYSTKGTFGFQLDSCSAGDLRTLLYTHTCNTQCTGSRENNKYEFVVDRHNRMQTGVEESNQTPNTGSPSSEPWAIVTCNSTRTIVGP
jgi:hypothetical protein